MSNNLSSGSQPHEADLDRPLYTPIKRRSFFMYAGATAGATALILAGCKDDNNSNSPSTVDVGSGDIGVLNYAYALEQLEAGFYTALRTGSYYTGLSATNPEKLILDDLYYHEVIHRDFFKAAIPTASVIKPLEPDFSKIDFNSRVSVLNAAKSFEDLGVAAYNGAGQFITSPGYLFIAGKIVSVEARHAAIIRDLVGEGTFVGNDIITLTSAGTSSMATNNAGATTSLERAMTPTEVVTVANTFLKDGSKLNVSNIK